MAYNLLTLNRGQSYLMPPSLWEWLDEGDLAWFILDAVDQMDLGEFYAAYRNHGWGAAVACLASLPRLSLVRTFKHLSDIQVFS